jgi:hypothetical protein
MRWTEERKKRRSVEGTGMLDVPGKHEKKG